MEPEPCSQEPATLDSNRKFPKQISLCCNVNNDIQMLCHGKPVLMRILFVDNDTV